MDLKKEHLAFIKQFKEITENAEYCKLKQVPRHGSTNTFDHSVRVAYMAYHLAKRWGLDADSAAKVGFLHDFCMIDYHKDDGTTHNGRWYCFYHPEDAVENSEAQNLALTETEKRAILTHMFPLSTRIPNSKIAYLLTLSDKTVALQESWQNAVDAFARFREMLHLTPKKAPVYVRNRKEEE